MNSNVVLPFFPSGKELVVPPTTCTLLPATARDASSRCWRGRGPSASLRCGLQGLVCRGKRCMCVGLAAASDPILHTKWPISACGAMDHRSGWARRRLERRLCLGESRTPSHELSCQEIAPLWVGGDMRQLPHMSFCNQAISVSRSSCKGEGCVASPRGFGCRAPPLCNGIRAYVVVHGSCSHCSRQCVCGALGKRARRALVRAT